MLSPRPFLVGFVLCLLVPLCGTGSAFAATPPTPPPAPAPPGYWLLAADGGIFTFASPYDGSTGSVKLNKPIVGMAASPDGGGYWLVASDGGIFTFGDATFYGSTGSLKLNKPIVGMSATSSGHGYWLVASDGGIFSFGDATYYGSTGGIRLNQSIAGMAATSSGHGYWLVASDGGIFTYGDAPFIGSMGGKLLNQPIVALAVDPIGDPYPRGTTGYDISFPQCGKTYPSPPYRVTIVGINDGRPYTAKPGLASEAAWAGPSLTVYVNVGPLNAGDPAAMQGPAGSCGPSDLTCQAYNWGWNAAIFDGTTATKAAVAASVWWLDIEFANQWKTSADEVARNDVVIQATIDGLRAQGHLPGIYSTAYAFGLIAGTAYSPQVPLWVPGAADASEAPGFCDPSHAFGGGQIWLTQWTGSVGGTVYDQDYAC